MSNLPPGCTNRMIKEAAGAYDVCECCGHGVEDCICPECPICTAAGDPRCYVGTTECSGNHHNLTYNAEQLAGQAQYREYVEQEQREMEAHAQREGEHDN